MPCSGANASVFEVMRQFVAALTMAAWLLSLAGCESRPLPPATPATGGTAAQVHGETNSNVQDRDVGQTLAAARQAVLAGKTTDIELDAQLVSDADLTALADLRRLKNLTLRRTNIGNAGAAQLGRLVGLEKLVLAETTIDDQGLQALSALTNLRILNLGTSRVTDAGLAHLAGLEQLKLLRLGSSRVVGPGLTHLSGLPLEQLILQNAPLDDSGLPALAKIGTLQSLYVQGTHVSDEGIDRLRQALPELHVH